MVVEESYKPCDGKCAYKTRQMAERVVKKMNQTKRLRNRRGTGHAPARAYRCDYCGEYHITGRKNLKKEL